eukprot:gene11249-15093_t
MPAGPYIDMDGRRVQLPDEFSLEGKITILDTVGMAVNYIKSTDLYKSYVIDSFIGHIIEKTLNNLVKGDMVAIVTVISSIFIAVLLSYLLMTSLFSSLFGSKKQNKDSINQEEVEPIVLRDFTIEQLRENDGSNDKPIYIALRGEVYDVSAAKEFYGEGSGYHCFAGRESSRAMAKLSFEEEDLASMDLSDLGVFERTNLEGWIQKFKHYKCYPIVGRVSIPPKNLSFTRSELKEFKGLQAVPEGRVDAPIYLAINGKVLDVSYGGKEMYGSGCPYFRFAGIDASRALAKMSFDEEALKSSDLSDLTQEQLKTLSEWEKKFIEVKKYPIVGCYVDETTR